MSMAVKRKAAVEKIMTGLMILVLDIPIVLNAIISESELIRLNPASIPINVAIGRVTLSRKGMRYMNNLSMVHPEALFDMRRLDHLNRC